MKNLSFLLISVGLMLAQIGVGQTVNFQATWNFDNKTKVGVSDKPSLVSASDLGSTGVTILEAVGGWPASPSEPGFYANVQFWPTNTGACTGSDYLEFSVTPQIGATTPEGKIVKGIDITEVSFLVSSSAQGPRSLVVTSSLNGFNINQPLIQTTLTQSANPFTWQTVSITGLPSSKNITTTATFRIIACQASSANGTLRLDNIKINGDIVLPADIVSFTARADNQQVRLDWATSWERNADRFVAEASSDLRQFRRVGEVPSNGTTDERHLYTLTDETPAPGPNYYRLAQIDRDGSVHYSKVISAILRPDAPALLVTPNPTDGQQITLRLPATGALELTVTDMLGRTVVGRLVMGSGTEAAFVPDRPLTAGRYWLRLVTPTGSTGVAVLVP